MMDVDIQLRVADGKRHFDLHARFCTQARVVAIFGPSGAGKSLTLQAMAGLLHPKSGHIRFGGQTLFDQQVGINLAPPRRRLGYLFQHYALFPHLTVRENVAFGLTNWLRRKPTAESAKRVQHLLERHGLTELADSRPAALSGGQKQRVALARALACQPQALLLDEPFAALNPLLRNSLRQWVTELITEAALPTVVVTHDIDDVLALADAALLYRDGRIVREIDVHRSEGRDCLADALDVPLLSHSPARQKLAQLLDAG